MIRIGKLVELVKRRRVTKEPILKEKSRNIINSLIDEKK